MYFEGGVFSGSLRMSTPVAYCTSQSCMLFDHLEKREPDALYALIYRINSDQIVSNDQPITALLELTGKSVRELEEAYQSHARGGRARRAR